MSISVDDSSAAGQAGEETDSSNTTMIIGISAALLACGLLIALIVWVRARRRRSSQKDSKVAPIHAAEINVCSDPHCSARGCETTKGAVVAQSCVKLPLSTVPSPRAEATDLHRIPPVLKPPGFKPTVPLRMYEPTVVPNLLPPLQTYAGLPQHHNLSAVAAQMGWRLPGGALPADGHPRSPPRAADYAPTTYAVGAHHPRMTSASPHGLGA